MSARVGTRSTCSQLRSSTRPWVWPGALRNIGTHIRSAALREPSTLVGLPGVNPSVVGGEHYHRGVPQPLTLQAVDHRAEQLVGVGDLEQVPLVLDRLDGIRPDATWRSGIGSDSAL